MSYASAIVEVMSSASQLAARVVAAVGGGPATAERLGEIYQAELARDHGKRRAAGAFYTPAHIVELVVEKTLGPALAARSADEILALRVLDPACGSGVFLVAALAAIEDALGDRGRARGPRLRAMIASSCLSGVDIDPVAVELCRVALAEAVGLESRASLSCADALIDELPTVDVVIGNPPWGQKEVRFDAGEKRALRSRYVVGVGVLDPFKLFVERAHQLTREGGRWGFVLPDIVLTKNQEPVRQLMLEQSSLEWVAHAGRCFVGVNLDAVVIVGRRGAPAPGHETATLTALDAAPGRRRQSTFAGLPGRKLNIFASDEELALVDRLRPLPALGEQFEIHEGVHSGNRRAALFVPAPRPPSAPLIVGGSELAPFRLRWAGRHIALDPDHVEPPGYANLGRPSWHLRAKIVVRRTGDHIVAAADHRGYYVSNNLFVVVPRASADADELDAVVAILCSRFMTWYFRTIEPRVGRLFAELKINHLATFPIPRTSRTDLRELARLTRLLSGWPCRETARRAIEELEARVATLYGLSPAERSLVTLSHCGRSRSTIRR